ncbi:MarR family transcriptional regulator [Paenibacillus profundus]|uniref:MarR family transcriptional regulator n=1 Tax=Paenibacillus profundus TaxID=1173085 RepID=A0ABS8YAK2_9BACL|nr:MULTISPECIES: MarR family transcriptional regulator [Paenibacillus]MCE5168407.1 MarR family transcriptional regulator [Paenibacillus profundus]MCM3339299.1 MarR family transcriptional regulator [Paenibacillus sp. MER TA 81-3]
MQARSQLLELSTLFRLLLKRMTQEWNKRMIANLSFSQFRILYKLNEGGKKKVSELAEALCITSGAITGGTDKLIKEGLAERKRAEDDRRVVYIYITDKGRDIVQMMLERQKETISMFFESLPNEDVGHLKRIFTQILENTEGQSKE